MGTPPVARGRRRDAWHFGDGRLAWRGLTRKARTSRGGIMHRSDHRMETIAVHSGRPGQAPEGSVVFPIYQGTVYSLEPGADYHDIRYIRLNSTPSQRYLHDRLAGLEEAEAAVATSSGMAAITSTLLAFLK